MQTFISDVRIALRSMARRPGFVSLVLTTIALGISANTLIFSVVNGTLLKPLPYPEPQDVVLIRPGFHSDLRSSGHVAVAEYFELRSQSRAFAHVGAVDVVEVDLVGSGPPQEIVGARVSPSILEVLGVSPRLGRGLLPDDDAAGAEDVVVLSHSFWQRTFSGDPGALGRSIHLDRRPYTVVGVMPAGFVLPTELETLDRTEFLIPLRANPANPGSFAVKDLDAVIGRLASGATMASAVEDVRRIASAIAAEHPENYPPDDGWSLTVIRPRDEATGGVRRSLLLLVSAVALLLLVTCANVAGLILTRGAGRRRELAVRAALGAGRGRLARQLLTEAGLLASMGGLLGATAAFLILPIVRHTLFGSFPRADGIVVDASVLLFVLGVIATTGILFGLVPAWRLSGLQLRGALVGRGTGAGPTDRAARRGLVITEVAVTTLLIIGSTLMTRSLLGLWRIDPGFESSDVLTFRVSTPSHSYPDQARVNDFYRRLERELGGVPGVHTVGLVRRRPLADRVGTWSLVLDGPDGPWRPEAPPEWQVVTPGYFAALDIRSSKGRLLGPADISGPAGPILVNEAFAEAYWPGSEVIGAGVRMDGGPNNPWLTVVGVVENVRHDALVEGPHPRLYIPHPHFAQATSMGPVRGMSVVLKTGVPPAELSDEVRAALWSLDETMPITSLRTMREIVAGSIAGVSLLTLLLNAFGALALSLAVVGIYGLISHEVTSRTREIGVRSALGADRFRLARLFLGEALVLGATGVAIGSLAALAAGRFLSAQVYGVTTSDSLTYGAVALALCGSALLASYLPARRAARLPPMEALGLE